MVEAKVLVGGLGVAVAGDDGAAISEQQVGTFIELHLKCQRRFPEPPGKTRRG